MIAWVSVLLLLALERIGLRHDYIWFDISSADSSCEQMCVGILTFLA